MNIANSVAPGSSLQAFYTTAEGVLEVMSLLLGDVTGLNVLEPAAGGGAFLRNLIGNPARLDAIDVDEESARSVRHNFPNANAIQADFIDLFVDRALERHNLLQSAYDAAIANPPYGLKIPLPYRKKIKRLHPEVYARESYGLFLHFTICMLKPSGRYVFIVPDTFLQSVYHKPLREHLVRMGAPSHIIQFHSKKFETVNFGYGKLCIIAGNARALSPEDKVLWKVLEKDDRLNAEVLAGDTPLVSGRLLLEGVESGWASQQVQTAGCLDNWPRLGQLSECRTGIYSGDNSRFFAFDRNQEMRRPIGRSIEWDTCCYVGQLTEQEKENGIEGQQSYIPLVRGGHRAPLQTTRTAIDWSREAVIYYRTDPKARLQNSRFYFRRGLAVPMVTSGRLTASLMENAVFDQGVVGVFPHDPKLLDFLLIYLNSDFVSALKGQINSSANNSANYLKRLPVPYLTEAQMLEASAIVTLSKNVGWEATRSQRQIFLQDVTI